LRVATCDKSNAESGDNVYVSVSENGVSREMLAGKLGLERGKSKDFELTGHVPVDAKEIDGLKIRKSGTNAWCISRVELWRNGELAWRFDDGDPNWSDLIREDGPQEALYRGLQPSSGSIWLDDERDHAPSRSVEFSDVVLPVPPRMSAAPLPGYFPILFGVRPIELEIQTCSDGTHPQTNDGVVAILQHDGISETIILDNVGNDRQAGSLDRYTLNEHGLNSLGWLQIRKTGSDGWCIASIAILAAGQEVFRQTQRIILDSDPQNPAVFPATNLELNRRAMEESQAEDWYYPGIPLKASRFWNYEHSAKGQPCLACEPQSNPLLGFTTCKRCDAGLACGDDICSEAGGANQLCNPAYFSPIDLTYKPQGCDSPSLDCVETAHEERRCVAGAGKRDHNCRDKTDERGECDVDATTHRQLMCDPVDRLCFLPGTEGNGCRADGTCDGKLVCAADRTCINPLTAKNRWFKSFQSCRAGSADCNVCAPNVKAQFDRAAGSDQFFATGDSAEEMKFRDAHWNFVWDKDYAPSGRNPDNVFNKHVQGFVRTNNDRIKYAGTYSNRDSSGGGIFIIEQNSNGVKHMVNMHGARHHHPSGLSAFGKYLVFSDAPSEVRLIDINRRSEDHLIAWRAPGIKRAGGGIGMAKLEGSSYLLVVSPSGSNEGSSRNVRFFHLTGNLESPVVKSVGDWQYKNPASWDGDYRYTENLSVISECGTGDVYVVNTTGKPTSRGYWLLSKVINAADGTGLALQPLKAYFQDNEQSRCSLRASATVSINANGEIEPLCSERASFNGWFDGNEDTLRFRYGVF
jgi:hypothetical protein